MLEYILYLIFLNLTTVIIMIKDISSSFQSKFATLLDYSNVPQKKLSINQKIGFVSKMFASIFQNAGKPAVQKKLTDISCDFLTSFCNSSSALVRADEKLSQPATSYLVNNVVFQNVSHDLSSKRPVGVTSFRSPKDSTSPLAKALKRVEFLLPKKIVSSKNHTKNSPSVSPPFSGSQEILPIQCVVSSHKKNEVANSPDDAHPLMFPIDDI